MKKLFSIVLVAFALASFQSRADSPASTAPIGVATNPTAGNQDVKLAQEPPVILPRFAGAQIIQYSYQPLDSEIVKLAFLRPGFPIIFSNQDKSVSGHLTKIAYQLPNDTPLVAVQQYYETLIQNAGGAVAYACDNTSCTGNWGNASDACSQFGEYLNLAGYASAHLVIPRAQTGPTECHYFVGYFPASGGDGDVYVSVLIYDQQMLGGDPLTLDRHRTVTVLVNVMDAQNFSVKTVSLDADAMAAKIAATGKVAVYGIYFDTGKYQIKPTSLDELQQIAKLLENNPSLHVLIVGHTDSQGDYNANMLLSMNRAKSVVTALEDTYHIDPSRLRAVGDGMTAPVSTNDTDAGRALNRRVELVKD